MISEEPVKDDDVAADTKKAVLNLVTSNLYRFVNASDDSDNKGLLMLIAALAVLNNTDHPNSVQVARRLAQMALARSGKKKG